MSQLPEHEVSAHEIEAGCISFALMGLAALAIVIWWFVCIVIGNGS